MTDNNFTIEMYRDFKEKLNIAELVLKTLGIKYQIITPTTHTSNLKNSLLRKSLAQIQDELTILITKRDDYESGSN
ncbi:MAG: hypothetical protein ACFE9C_16445 [Candidatus Hodarchaeota archaeon]